MRLLQPLMTSDVAAHGPSIKAAGFTPAGPAWVLRMPCAAIIAVRQPPHAPCD